ncbi:phage tail tape measure protein, TP901 family [Desulfurivibrio alkaliphilus]|uniref:Phage tail tape measure protein, TP901 family n=1 Tax=Desulfurivibrio alkaliphilus (strain DSM 19089 / UNIQEM U267 / AHT2) TaxID=589865 RepID=D6Z5J6_DESAT|nr:phage tail tape measure protein, TP901 family [Desulfurivibrio alkaliphilus]ADH86733.1 phage tail tape measure protein, TP901 family [Desulfurivibrio alkaliphilus AHT 2]
MSRVHEIAFKLAGQVGQGFNNAFTSANGHVSRLDERLRGMNQQARRVDAFQNLEREVSSTGVELMQARTEVSRLGQEMQATTKPSTELRRSFSEAQKRVSRLEKSLQSKNQRLADSRAELGRAGINTANLAREHQQLQRQIQATQMRMQGFQRIAGSGLQRNLQQTGAEAMRLGRRVATLGGAAAAGIFGLAYSTAKFGDHAAKTSTALGMNAEAYMELSYAGGLAGVSADKLDSSLTAMTRRVSQAAAGSGEARNALEEMGISAQWLNQLSPERQLEELADAFKHVENENDRARLAMDLFSRQGVGMVNMLKDGSAALRETRAEGRRSGAVLGKEARKDAVSFMDSLQKVTKTASGVRHMFGARLMPVVTNVMEKMSSYFEDNTEKFQRFADIFAQKVSSAIPKLMEISRNIYTATSRVAGFAIGITNAIGGVHRLAYILALAFSAKLIIGIVKTIHSLVMVVSGIRWVIAATRKLHAASLTTIALNKAKAAGAIAYAGAQRMAALATKGWTTAQWLLNAAMTANPIGMAVAGAAALAAGAYLLIRNWKKVSAFFVRLPGISHLIEQFQRVRDWLHNLSLFDSGAALVVSLVRGIVSRARAPVDAVRNIVSNARDLLPFSDAKSGPLSNLSKSGPALMQTIAAGIKGKEIHDRVAATIGQAKKAIPAALAVGLAITPIAAPAAASQVPAMQAHYQVEPPQVPRLPDLAAAARWQAQAPDLPRLQGLQARARYQAETPQAPRLPDVASGTGGRGLNRLLGELTGPGGAATAPASVHNTITININATGATEPSAAIRNAGRDVARQAVQAIEEHWQRQRRLSYD